MAESDDNRLRQFQSDGGNTHRKRLLYLDSSDRPANGQVRVSLPIPLPGMVASRPSVHYNYQDTFKNGSMLGIRPRRIPDQPLFRSPRPISTEIEPSSASGSAAMRRRTYAITAPSLEPRARRRRSGAGFEGQRPFKEPLTPRTHDNKTGKGRIQSSARRETGVLHESDIDREVFSIDATPDKDNPVLISPSPASTTKRQKLSHSSRRHIKIAHDDDHSDVEIDDPNSTTKAQSLDRRQFSEKDPIEIGSEEEDSTDTRTHPPDIPRTIPTIRGTQSTLQSPASVKIPRRVANDPGLLQYPDSDEESSISPARQTRQKYSKLNHGSTSLTTLKDGGLKSPYFQKDHEGVHHVSFGEHQERIGSDMASDGEDTPVVFRSIDDAELADSPQSEAKVFGTHIYNFAIDGLGGQIQTIHTGWQMLVQEAGFRFLDASRKPVISATILSSNVGTWISVDDIGLIQITLKTAIPKFGVRQVYITLKSDERNRFIRMQQSWSSSHPLYRKLTHADPAGLKICRESYATLREAVASPLRRRNQREEDTNSSILDIYTSFGAHSVSKKKSAATNDQSTPATLESGREIYDSAISSKNHPIPIALPRGRDIDERKDEHHLLVDNEEVNETKMGQAVKEHLHELPVTRRATRAREERAVRNSRAAEPLLVYPNIKGQTSVTLYEEDLDRLKPDEFLNDSIVEFYLRYNYDNLREEQRQQAHVFNTFFYQRLTAKKDKDANYEAVKKWTSKGKGVDIFSKRFLVIPINESLHWYLAVVVNLDRVVFGPDVGRASEVSFINAENDIDPDDFSQEGSTQIDTSNILDGLEEINAADILLKRSDASPEPIEERTASIISQTPPNESQNSKEDMYDFCEETKQAPPQHRTRLSLTESIRAEELAKNPSLRPANRQIDTEAKAMEHLTLEDDSTKSNATSEKMTKKSKTKKVGPGYSKPGKHITADTPTIIILDSLHGSHNKVYEVIKDYLVREAGDKKNEVLSPKQFATCKADLPRQDNYSDCGLFLIQYAQTLLSQANVVPQLLNKVKFSSPTALEAHKRSFKNMFEIDRIPLRRKEMTEQLLQLSVPYRREAREAEQLRKHERALAKSKSGDSEDTPDPETSCRLLSSDSMAPKQLAAEVEQVPDSQRITSPPRLMAHSATTTHAAHEDSIDELDCL